MILSLTGFGRGESTGSGVQIVVELKCLNSKVLDVGNIRLPSRYRVMEVHTRQRISEVVGRGKVEVYVSVKESGGMETESMQICRDVLLHYVHSLREMGKSEGYDMSVADAFTLASRMPGVASPVEPELVESEESAYREALEAALESLVAFREQEGRATETFLLGEVRAIEMLRRRVDGMKDVRIEEVKARFAEALEQLRNEEGDIVDENRLAQEIFYHIERLDINEELQRLEQHCSYFEETVREETSQGRKLNFISQEMGREINTIGSKSNNVAMQRCVVEMKDHLERIKEQVLNVL